MGTGQESQQKSSLTHLDVLSWPPLVKDRSGRNSSHHPTWTGGYSSWMSTWTPPDALSVHHSECHDRRFNPHDLSSNLKEKTPIINKSTTTKELHAWEGPGQWDFEIWLCQVRRAPWHHEVMESSTIGPWLAQLRFRSSPTDGLRLLLEECSEELYKRDPTDIELLVKQKDKKMLHTNNSSMVHFLLSTCNSHPSMVPHSTFRS